MNPRHPAHRTLHVAVVTRRIPNPDVGGHMVNVWSILKWLRQRGHRVTSISLVSDGMAWMNLPRQTQALRDLGIDVIEVPHAPSRANRTARGIRRLIANVFFPFDVAFLGRTVAPQVQQLLQAVRPDVVFAGHYEGVAATYGFRQAPIMALLGDPYHLPPFYRWWHTRESRSLWHNVRDGVSLLRIYPSQVWRLRRMLRACAVVSAAAAHHSAWYARVAGRPCLHLPSPVEDRTGGDWWARRQACPPNQPPRILSLGPLGQTVNIPGIKMFLRDVLPLLDRELGPDGFEVHFIGEPTNAPRELVELSARRTNIRIRGFVQSLDEELLAGEVVLALNPIPLGNRVRIASAFSFGCCVVSHRANQHGMPALQHEYNVLLAESAPEVAQALVRAIKDDQLRRTLGKGARETYEHVYGDTACARVEEELLHLVDGRSGSGVRQWRER